MKTSMRVLVVDDEELARARIKELLAGIPDVEVAGEAENGLRPRRRGYQPGVP